MHGAPLRSLALALLLLPTLPPAHATSSPPVTVTPIAATGPDADGAWDLAYDVEPADGPARVTLALDVTRDGAPAGTRDLGPARDLPAGTTRVHASFLPDAPGAHDVRLLVDGAPTGPALRFSVRDGAGATTTMTFQVADEPTFVNLTSDTVNADGKVKSPGETLTTRVTVSDANGLAELDAPLWRVEGPDGFLDSGVLEWNATGTATSLEQRYARSPLAATTYRLTILAAKRGATVASATRTFVIRDVAPTFDAANTTPLASVTPDVDVTQTVDLLIADKNGAPLAAPLEARVYRGSARAESSGFVAALDAAAPRALADGADGTGRAAYPLRLTVPALAAPGTLRVSIYVNGTLAGSLPFNVTPLPLLASVTQASTEDALQLDVHGSGDGLVTTVLTDRDGGTLAMTQAFTNGNATVSIAAPSASGSFAWNVTLRARENGPALAWRTGNWTRVEPALVATVVRAGPRAFAWTLDAPGWDLADATANVSVTRWDGAPATAFAVAYADGQLSLDAPAALAAGRYQASVALRLANGSVARASWTFEAGPWMRVTLGNVTVAGREARIVVQNDGGVPFRRLVVEADGVDALALATGALPSATANGRVAFAGLDVAPGASATLVARLADGPRAAGAHAAKVRVFALAGSG